MVPSGHARAASSSVPNPAATVGATYNQIPHINLIENNYSISTKKKMVARL